MTTLRGIGPALAGFLLLLTAACAQHTGAAGTGTGAGEIGNSGGGSLAGDAPVLRVELTGGFTSPAIIAARLPIVTVYGDGRVISEGPQAAVFPGPALPNVQVQRISTADVEALLARARAVGIDTLPDLGQPPVADVPNTRFTVLTDAGRQTVEVYALSESGGEGLNAEQIAGRRKLRDLLDALTDLPATLGTGRVGAAQPYTPVAVAAVAGPWTDPGDPALGKQAPVAWPGPALPGESLGDGLDLGCVTVRGEAVGRVLAAARPANALTPWTSGGKRWSVILRPLLPDESGCADLSSRS